MHMLSLSDPSLRLVGRSDWGGFTLYGEVATQAVVEAAAEGLARLKEKESWWAIHPRCGTNLAVMALLTGSAAYTAAAWRTTSKLARAVGIVGSILGAMAIARPMGLAAQHLTTSPDLDRVRVREVRREEKGGWVIHRVLIARDQQAESYVLHPSW